jgi:hypothetical protein
MKKLTLFITILIFVLENIFAEEGNIENRKQGIMDGNLVRTIYQNQGEIGKSPIQPSGEWPAGADHSYINGIAFIVSVATNDSNMNRIHPLETSYQEFMDIHPITKDPMGFEPLPGYANPNQNEIAKSDNPDTWPPFWPDRPSSWAGYWNGFFGKDVFHADLETYYVMDDDPDEEWDFFPDINDPERRGVGLEIGVRGFQWDESLLENVIFWNYSIRNEGTANYDSVYIAYYIDWAIGGTGDSLDDNCSYDTNSDLVWAWDSDGIGAGGWGPVGVAGLAFLKTPGNPYDGIDNDDDGLIDERRESGPGIWLDTYPYGVGDPEKFEKFYGRSPCPHWSGDEDGDWVGFTDVNENGVWDSGEPLNDDIGSDGVGPGVSYYPGPDIGEGDNMPTIGEPNFDCTDLDEDDQIGLTGFKAFHLHEYNLCDDEECWNIFISPPSQPVQTTNLVTLMSSGPISLLAGQTVLFSTSLLFGADSNDIFLNKKSSQKFYNSGFRFSSLTSINQNITLPIDISLYQNYPNPFNPTTTIPYQLPKSSFVNLSIYDISGRLVETLVSEHKSAGNYSVKWNPENVGSGIYFYKIDAGKFSSVKKCLLLK